jgi:hypothetical protein
MGNMCSARAISALRLRRSFQGVQGGRFGRENEESALEQQRNFAPYKTRQATKNIKFKLFCVPDRYCTLAPKSSAEKLILKEAGLGFKEVSVQDDPSRSPTEFRKLVQDEFPKLGNGGGFDFLKCDPGNSKQLQVIPTPYTLNAKHLKAFAGNSIIYLRPIQNNLDMCTEMLDEIKEKCFHCNQMINIDELKYHLEYCK